MELPPPALVFGLTQDEDVIQQRRQREALAIGALLSVADISNEFLWPYANTYGLLYGRAVHQLPISFPLIYFPEAVLSLTQLTKLDLSNNAYASRASCSYPYCVVLSFI